MLNTISLTVDLPASPAKLYSMYLNPRIHAAFTGAPVTIGSRPGSAFRAFGGALTGRILHVVAHRLIVQSWRSSEFGKRDIDSTLILTFTARRRGGRIDLTHVGVAERDLAGVSEGWVKYYFDPWRSYLERK